MGSALFWVITERAEAILYRCSLPNNPQDSSSQYLFIILRFLEHSVGTRFVITQDVRFAVITKY